MKKPLIIAHRGASGYELENTIAAFEKALQLNVDMIELDVYVVKSGEVVVFHDDTLDRLSNTHGEIEHFTLETLQRICLHGGYKIPSLKEVLQLLDGACKVNIELKGQCTAAPVVEIIHDFVATSNFKKDSFLISSFRWDELEKVKTIDATIPIAVLVEGNPFPAIEIAKKLNAVAVNPHYSYLNETNVNLMHSHHLDIYTWTVNDYFDIDQVKALGVDGIITNYPDRVLR